MESTKRQKLKSKIEALQEEYAKLSPNNYIVEALEQMFEETGMLQIKVADKLGVSRQSVSSLILRLKYDETYSPRLQTIKRMVDACGYKMKLVLYKDEDEGE